MEEKKEKKNNQEIEGIEAKTEKEEKEDVEAKDVETIEDRLNKKRMLIIGTIATAVALFIVFSFFSNVIFGLFQNPETPSTSSKDTQKTIAPKVEEDWKSITDMKVNQLEERMKKMEDTNQQILQILQQNQEKKETQEKAPPPPPSLPPLPPPPPPQPIQYNNNQPQGQQGQKQEQEQTPPTLKEFKPDKEEATPSSKDNKEETKETKETKDKEVSKAEKTKGEKVVINLPLGFLNGLTLTGLDAPTFQYGQNNPHPVLIVSLSKQIIANNKKLNLKECFFLGSGFGEISSERAYIRLVKISCIDKKGNILEQKVNGWVLDDDGKVGLKGRVVSKQGAVLAKTFTAGLLEGLSRTIAASSTTIQISPIGTTQTLKPEDVSQVALASGFQSAASRLAQFYMKIAEQMYPVVEVSAGRRITILISDGKLEKTGEDRLISNPLE